MEPRDRLRVGKEGLVVFNIPGLPPSHCSPGWLMKPARPACLLSCRIYNCHKDTWEMLLAMTIIPLLFSYISMGHNFSITCNAEYSNSALMSAARQVKTPCCVVTVSANFSSKALLGVSTKYPIPTLHSSQNHPGQNPGHRMPVQSLTLEVGWAELGWGHHQKVRNHPKRETCTEILLCMTDQYLRRLQEEGPCPKPRGLDSSTLTNTKKCNY